MDNQPLTFERKISPNVHQRMVFLSFTPLVFEVLLDMFLHILVVCYEFFLTTTAFSLNFTLPNLEILLVNIWGVGLVNKMLAVRYENRCSDSLEPMEKPGVKVKFEGQKKVMSNPEFSDLSSCLCDGGITRALLGLVCLPSPALSLTAHKTLILG